jgi:hypothetical protein
MATDSDCLILENVSPWGDYTISATGWMMRSANSWRDFSGKSCLLLVPEPPVVELFLSRTPGGLIVHQAVLAALEAELSDCEFDEIASCQSFAMPWPEGSKLADLRPASIWTRRYLDERSARLVTGPECPR